MRRKDRNKAKGKKLRILRNSIEIIPKIAVQASYELGTHAQMSGLLLLT